MDVLLIYQVFISGLARLLCMQQPQEDVEIFSHSDNETDPEHKRRIMHILPENGCTSLKGASGSKRFLNKQQPGEHDYQLSLLISLEQKVDKIKECISHSLTRTTKQEDETRIAHEWKVIALVLDRIFFIIYLILIIILLDTMHPRNN